MYSTVFVQHTSVLPVDWRTQEVDEYLSELVKTTVSDGIFLWIRINEKTEGSDTHTPNTTHFKYVCWQP